MKPGYVQALVAPAHAGGAEGTHMADCGEVETRVVLENDDGQLAACGGVWMLLPPQQGTCSE